MSNMAQLARTKTPTRQLDDLASPVLKIAGGKRDLADQICRHMPDPIVRYVEPFFGGGAVFFHLQRNRRLTNTKNVVIADIDPHLMSIYEDVRADPLGFNSQLERIHTEYLKAPEEAYYFARRLWNSGERNTTTNVFLRFGSFNGLWRENSKGEMNAPWSQRPKLALPSLGRLMAVSKALEGVEIASGDFVDVLEQHQKKTMHGTVLYVDSPYLGGWAGYNKSGWSPEQMELLIKTCQVWSDAGAFVVLSHSDVSVVRELLQKHWPSALLQHVERRNKINSDGTGRGPNPELIVRSR